MRCLQPVEKKYELTRSCLEILSKHAWPVTVQTKSPLVIRDLELLKKIRDVEVGFTITTADDGIREVFEPRSSAIDERIEALDRLHSEGIKTFAMIAPLLPQTEGLASQLRGKVDYVLVDKMNYHYADWVYRKSGLEYAMSGSFFDSKKKELVGAFEKEGISCQVLF